MGPSNLLQASIGEITPFYLHDMQTLQDNDMQSLFVLSYRYFIDLSKRKKTTVVLSAVVP